MSLPDIAPPFLDVVLSTPAGLSSLSLFHMLTLLGVSHHEMRVTDITHVIAPRRNRKSFPLIESLFILSQRKFANRGEVGIRLPFHAHLNYPKIVAEMRYEGYEEQ